ncbi:MAG: PTS sugar transporter subunit IIC [Peptoniphilus sp.]|nr:PTS sugar transporter subunit IIC [Peptoniphilus sp.]MDD7363771.1 PTS sugar transporter subunit IIC [Bacillota bacterium]MDY6044612.1 PTS sugar transporter subunit IIC [Peptoniphilus sp.]
MDKMTFREYILKVLGGVSVAIIIGAAPNAIFGELFKVLSTKHHLFSMIYHIITVSQLTLPILVGAVVAREFNLNPVETGSVAVATFIASGNVIMNGDQFMMTGVGDLINTILLVSIAIPFILNLRGKLGSIHIIAIPVLAVLVLGTLGRLTLPFVSQLTRLIGVAVTQVTTLQPLLMSVLIAMIFGTMIISPISTVAIGLAISLDGLASGAANIGVCSTTAFVVLGSMKVNKSGVTLAALLGSPKVFMKNWVSNPKLTVPILVTSGIAGLGAYLFGVQGTPASAGFGFIGLVGPLTAARLMEGPLAINLLIAILPFIVIPFIAAKIVNVMFFEKINMLDYTLYQFDEEVDKEA